MATWIFNHAIRLNYFAEIQALDYTLLKAVRELITGYEVESCPMWLWEKAILDGFRAFCFLREHRRGLVITDLVERRLTVEHV